MEKFQNDSKTDITEEPYAGPDAHIAALGTGVIKHLKWAIIGLFGGGLYALAFPSHATTAIKFFRKHAKNMVEAEGRGTFLSDSMANTQQWLGDKLFGVFGEGNLIKSMSSQPHDPRHEEWVKEALSNKKHGFGHWFSSHAMTVIPLPLGKAQKTLAELTDERWIHAFTFGGAFGAIGYISGWAKALVTGAQHGHQGKQQHNQLVAALKSERERNDDLEKINDELHAKYVAAATQKEEASEQPAASEKLADANEAPHQHAPAEAEADDAPTQQHHHETPEHSIHTHAEHDAHAEHHGKIHAHAPHEHAAHAHA